MVPSQCISPTIIEDADGLIISPQNTESVRASLNFAKTHGQEIVFFESQIKDCKPLALILADELEARAHGRKRDTKRLPTKARVAILTNESPSTELEQRMEGYVRFLATDVSKLLSLAPLTINHLLKLSAPPKRLIEMT